MASKEEQLFASLTNAVNNGDATLFATIKSENPQVYNYWLSNNLQNSALNDKAFQAAVNKASTAIQQQNDNAWAEALGDVNTNIYGTSAAQANADANGAGTKLTTNDWQQFDVDGSGSLSSEELVAYNKANAEKNAGESATFVGSDGTYGTQSTEDAIGNWAGDTFSTGSGLGSIPGVKENVKTAEAAANGDWDAVIGDMVNPKETLNPVNDVEAAVDVVDDATEDIWGLDRLGDQLGNVVRGTNGVISDVYNGDIGGAVSDRVGMAANEAQTAVTADIDDKDNPDGYQFDTDSWLDHGNSAENSGFGEATQNVVDETVDKIEDTYDNLTDGSGEGGGTSGSIFSNADEVNNILTNGTRAAQQTYGEQTATALQPLTEAKDAYNYKTQLDNYNQDWQNYKEQTASNNAYLDTQKDAAQNWETYMNPLTDYLNEQLAKNQRRSAGSMLGSSANEALVNQAIANNTATQYQNAVSNALADSQNNQNIANSQQNNANSYLSGANQTLTNNVTPTTDWTAYMTDFADTNLNANNNLVNAQAQIASQEPTTWDNISDIISSGVAIGSALLS